MINEFLPPSLPPNQTLWFQQDGATAHKAVISIAALRRFFPQRVISRFGDVPWPSCSPDLTAPDFFCGVIWKVKCAAPAIQTYTHSSKKYVKKSSKFQKKHYEMLCAAS
jgi:DNA-directed RNA polymerase